MMKRGLGVKILKYGVTVGILVYIIALLIMSGGSAKPFKDISAGVEKVIDTDTLITANTQGLRRYYGLNAADYQGVALYVSKSSMSAEELLLIEVKDTEQVEAVRDAVERRISQRRDDFDGYAPDEVELIDGSVTEVRGKFVFFTISKNAQKYKDAFTDSL